VHAPAPSGLTAPVAARRPTLRIHHGDPFSDPYEWLRDKKNPEVISYLEAENDYTEAQTRRNSELADAVFREIKTRTKETDLSVPSYAAHQGGGAYWYYSRTLEGAEYGISCRAPAPDRRIPPALNEPIEGEQVLLDGNLEAAGHDFFSLGAFDVSRDGRLLAYSVDLTGAERFTLLVKDLDTGTLLGDRIEDTTYGVAWAQNSHLFYTRADQAWRPYVVLRHRLGDDPAADAEVYTEPDERFWLGVDSSRDEEWVIVGAGSKLTSEYRILSTDDPEGVPRVVAPRRQGVEYDVEPAGDRLLIVHNDGAEDFALAQAPLDATDHHQWTSVIPHQPGVRILAASAYASHVVVSLRRNGLSGVHLIARDDRGDLQAGSDIDFAEPLYVVDAPGESEYDTPTIRLGYASMLTPDSVYDYDLATGEMVLLKRTPVLDDPTFGPYRPERYVQERGWAQVADGTRVPLSIVRRADVALDGSAPAVLYGYGSYEASIDPGFSISRLSLLDRGIVYAIAHVRGGGELGRTWYEQGKTMSKINTFTDFVACADFLIAHGYTAADRLAARGGSAGGLLMGAVANLAPDRFEAIHASVPFVDPLTSILDPELPLTVVEWEEWGDPLHDPEVYAYMKSYSPYENVAGRDYPAILATTSLNDTRVLYVEPAKWVAALRHAVRDRAGREILLKTEMTAGHGGVSGRYQAWRELAFEYAWIISQITRVASS
jgi:oligopeptidase B